MLVILESPYSGDIDRNVAYARAALRDALNRGEAPFASHLLYTQPGVFADHVAQERLAGIEAGFKWRSAAAKTVVYEDLGITEGMRAGIRHAESLGQPVEFRRLYGG